MGNSIKPSLWDRVFNRKAVTQATTRALQEVQRNVIINQWGISASYIYHTLQERVEAYASNAALYSIVSRISKTAAVAPFKVYRIKDKKKHLKYKNWTGANATPESLQRAMYLKEQVYEEDNSHKLNKLIDRPNKWCRGTEFTINAIGFKLLSGNRVIRKIMVGDKMPQSLEIMPSQFMSVIPDGTLYGVAGYRFMMGGTDVTFTTDEIIHSKDFNPQFDNLGSHLWGLSPLSAAYKNLQRAESGLDRSVIMLQNGGSPGLLYSEEVDSLTPEQAQALKAKVNTEVLGIENANKIALANGKMGFINFGLTAVDMEILDLEKYSWQQLCNIFGVPPGLFDPDKSGEHNAQEFKKELITSAVMPQLSSLRDDWNEIANDDSVYIDSDISVYPELQEDMDKVADRLNKMPYLTWNEKRLIVGQDEDTEQPLMNEYFVPSGLTPMSQLKDNTADLTEEVNRTSMRLNEEEEEI